MRFSKLADGAPNRLRPKEKTLATAEQTGNSRSANASLVLSQSCLRELDCHQALSIRIEQVFSRQICNSVASIPGRHAAESFGEMKQVRYRQFRLVSPG
jgi:hypothetical protein